MFRFFFLTGIDAEAFAADTASGSGTSWDTVGHRLTSFVSAVGRPDKIVRPPAWGSHCLSFNQDLRSDGIAMERTAARRPKQVVGFFRCSSQRHTGPLAGLFSDGDGSTEPDGGAITTRLLM